MNIRELARCTNVWRIAMMLCCLPLTTARAAEKAADLTSLSLQELYNLDVVQINVLGAHTHPKGQAMFGYHYMFMNMEGIRKGDREITPADVFAEGFTVAHTRMQMQMHMMEAMYAPTDRLTLMAMLPYKVMSMQHAMPSGNHFTQHVDGVGDVEVLGSYTVLGDNREGGNRVMLNAGLSLPTGSIEVKDHRMGDPAMRRVKLEYPMQLGSGTYDLLPGLTYLGESHHWSWGAQTIATVRLGRNDNDYRLGNQYRLTTWAAYGITDWLAPYIRFDGRVWENVHGRDTDLNPRASAEANPRIQAGKRVDALFGLTVYAPKGVAKGTRVMVEGGFPVYEHLKGPQLGTDYILSAGVTYAF
jgi:hypothetical protein